LPPPVGANPGLRRPEGRNAARETGISGRFLFVVTDSFIYICPLFPKSEQVVPMRASPAANGK